MVPLCPSQIVVEETVTVGRAFTITVQVPEAVQVATVPVIVYTVVAAGDAVTVEPEAELNPVEGFQE